MKCHKLIQFTAVALAVLSIAPAYADAKKNTGNSAQAAQMLSAVVAIDSNEILIGAQAKNSNASSDVSDFAKMMVEEHGKNLTEAVALANKLHVTSLNANPNGLRDKGVKELTTLGANDGDAYNKPYVDAMVKGHEAALSAVDGMLKTVKDADLKTFLTDTRTAVEHHLDDAKKLQEKLK